MVADTLTVKFDNGWIERNYKRLSENTKDKKEYIKRAVHLVNGLSRSPLSRKFRKLTSFERAELLVVLCRRNQIPARFVSGLILHEEVDSVLHYWVQIFDDNHWVDFDPTFAHLEKVPRNFLPLSYSGKDFILTNANQKVTIDFDISEEHDTTGTILTKRQNVLRIFDLTRLARELQEDLVKLFLLPFAVLLTAFIRMMIGIRCYGTFTPSLLALSLMSLNWGIAFFLFVIVAIIAVLGRSLLPAKMTRVPRLSIVFILVAMGLAIGLSVLEYNNLVTIGQSVLLSIVVLTGLIDRLYTAYEEEGRHNAMVRLVWTFIIAILCMPIVSNYWLGYQMIKYPEIHFTTIALILLMYNYRGKLLIRKLPHSWFFEKETKKKKTKSNTDNEL